MADKTEHEAAFNQGAAQSIVMEQIHGVEHVLVPPGSSLKSLENLLPAPTRIKANPEFNDVAGFVDYTDEFKEEGSRIFVDQDKRRFFTIFDSHAKGVPAWGDHCASLQVNHSNEWTRFKSADGVQMKPMDLAEFLEDNLAYITGPIDGADLLTMVQNLKVQLKGELNVEHTQQSGLKKYLIQDDSTLRGKNKDSKELVFPEKIQLALRIFDNHDAYPIEVFLRDRVQKETVIFWIKIPDANAIEEQAFDRIITEVRDTTKLKTLKGRWEGPRHK